MGVGRRKIDSVNLESELVGNLEENRRRLQRDFSRTRKNENVPTSTHRLLQLASSGDVGIAKSEALEQLRFNPGNKGTLEILAILETYEQESLQIFFWCDRLLQGFPENKIGKSLESMRSSMKFRDWDLARESSSEVLDFDDKNWYGLIVNAKSNAALGDWHAAAEKWSVIRDLREMSEEEEYESARTLYNSKRFEDIIEKSVLFENGDFEERMLELVIRSNYNLGHDERSVKDARKLLQRDSENEIALRFLSRGLIRQGRLSLAMPIIENYCEVFPYSVNAWESLIETKLLMDKVDDASEAWQELRKLAGEDHRVFFCALEVALRFNWKDKYRNLLEMARVSFDAKEEFAENVADIVFRTGDLGESWRVLSSFGINPIESTLCDNFGRVFSLTGTNQKEVDEIVKAGGSVWVSELVTKEVMRKAGVRNKLRKKNRICHMITSSLDRGGAERQVAMTLKHIQGNGKIECYLATHRVENKRGLGTYYDELSGLHSRIYDLGDIDDSNQNLPGMNIIEENSELLGLLDSVVQRKVKQLICHFSEYSPDLVHAWQDETILTSSIAAALTGIPILIGSARSLRPDEKTDLHLRKRPYLQSCFKEIFKSNSHHLSCNSIAGSESYSHWIGIDRDSIPVNENGVDFEEISSRMDITKVREAMDEFGFSQKNKIVGGLFRLEAGKRPELWIESFNVAREIDPSLRGVIVGGGRMEETVRKWIDEAKLEGYVKLIGEVTDVGSWLSIMDVFLFTSATEGLPNVLIEAQGFGVPVVSTKVGGVPEIVADGETGILVEQSSSVILGKAIIEILGDKDFSEVRKITEKRTRERFSVKEMASRTVEMYSRVMSLDNSND